MIMATQTQHEQDPVGYPDFTLPVSIIAQIIEKLKVDIVAQTLAELKIDITSQTLPELDVNIAASAVILDVNIASSAAVVDIDISAQTISVKLVPDWGAIQAEDVDVYGTKAAASGSYVQVLSYTVPTGKTLLIYDWSIAIYGSDGQVVAYMYNNTDDLIINVGGGARGFQTPLSKPKRIGAGKTVSIWARQDTGASQSLLAHFGGTLL